MAVGKKKPAGRIAPVSHKMPYAERSFLIRSENPANSNGEKRGGMPLRGPLRSEKEKDKRLLLWERGD